VLAAGLAAAALTGCTAARQEVVQPRDGRSGLQLTGTLKGRQTVVAEGLPELVVGDCDPGDASDDDVCVITDTIDGGLFVLTFENPGVLEPGATVPVADPGCATPAACDAVSDVAVVTVKLDTDEPVPATGGSVRLTRLDPPVNYVGELTLELPIGRLSGGFDLVPRPGQ